MFNFLVLKDGSFIASFVALVGQEKYRVFLICSKEHTFIFKKKSGKVWENIEQEVYKTWL